MHDKIYFSGINLYVEEGDTYEKLVQKLQRVTDYFLYIRNDKDLGFYAKLEDIPENIGEVSAITPTRKGIIYKIRIGKDIYKIFSEEAANRLTGIVLLGIV